MSNVVELKAATRHRAGKGAARATRRAGQIPAVIYGDKKPPYLISLERRDLDRMLETGHFLTTLFNVKVDGEPTRVIPRDVQFDPVRDAPIHVDFLRLGEGARIDIWVPVRFINEDDSPGLKRGGVLNVVRYEIEVNCSADAMPDEFIGDLSGMDIGDALHISSIQLPEGVTPTITERDFTVATIAAPAGLKSEEEEAEEAAAAAEAAEGEEGEEGEEKPEGEDKDEEEGKE